MGENVALDGQATTALPEVHHLTDKGTADNPLRVGLIGLGSMGRHHARVIRATEGMELVAVADPGGDRFGVAGELPVLPDVHALIDAGLDAAMVAVPTVYHEDVALALAEAGVPCASASTPVSSVRSTRSSPAARAPSRPASATSASSRIWPPTTST